MAPVALPVWVLATARRGDKFAVDFHHVFWPAARLLLHGDSPYGAGAHLATPFVYPPPAAWLFTPFGLLPHSVADVVFVASLLAATFASLKMLGVTDWRCYGVAAAWPPVVFALQIANVSLLLTLGLALLWRVRHRALAAALVVAALVVLKLFLWPLGVWLVARHGLRSGVVSAFAAGVTTLGAWAAIGFRGLTAYPHILSDLERQWGPSTYSAYAFGLRLGVDGAVARALPLVIGGAVLLGAIWLGRRDADGVAPFAAAIVAAILISPVVWLHYLVLLLVPVAILRPRFGPLWVAPLALWVCPDGLAGPSFYPLALFAACGVLLATATDSVPLASDVGRKASPTND